MHSVYSTMHIEFQSESAIQSANVTIPKCQNGTLELSLKELAIINVLKANPSATQKQIAEMTGKSERTIKRRTLEMQDKGLFAERMVSVTVSGKYLLSFKLHLSVL